jgi:uncharacterized membrane protein YdbT with pleckstrin-like domain
MFTFIIISVIGGILKFIYGVMTNELDWLDIVALLYAIGISIAMIIYYNNTGIDPTTL